METLTSRTAVTVARHPLWLDALGQLLTRVGVKVEGHTTSPAAGLALVEQTRARPPDHRGRGRPTATWTDGSAFAAHASGTPA